MKEMICINCPMGCHLTVDDSDKSNIKVTGNTCPRGVTYAVNEVTSPKRMVTGSVKVVGGDIPMCSVKTVEAIPKGPDCYRRCGCCKRLRLRRGRDCDKKYSQKVVSTLPYSNAADVCIKFACNCCVTRFCNEIFNTYCFFADKTTILREKKRYTWILFVGNSRKRFRWRRQKT